MRGGAFFNGKEGRDDFRKTAPEGGYILPSEEEGLVRGGALLAGETER